MLSCATASLGGSYSSVAMADGECVVDDVSAMLGPSVAIELVAELAFTTPAGSALRLTDSAGVYLRACESGEYVAGAGHSDTEPGLVDAMVRASDDLADILLSESHEYGPPPY